jgi:hypothetical protein
MGEPCTDDHPPDFLVGVEGRPDLEPDAPALLKASIVFENVAWLALTVTPYVQKRVSTF